MMRRIIQTKLKRCGDMFDVILAAIIGITSSFYFGEFLSIKLHFRIRIIRFEDIIALFVLYIAATINLWIVSSPNLLIKIIVIILPVASLALGFLYGEDTSSEARKILDEYCHLKRSELENSDTHDNVPIDLEMIFGSDE